MRLIFGFILLAYYSQILAFPCYVTLVKDSCWLDYEVKGQVIDEVKKTQLATVAIPKGQQYGRVKFECEANQELAFTATFQPAFWASDKDTVYRGKKFIFLPSAPSPGEVAWNVPVCFGESFTKIPLPPESKGNCVCDFSSVPAIAD